MDENNPGAGALFPLLIVDDTPVDLHALGELLKNQGHEVRHVSSGELAPQPAVGTQANAELEERIQHRTAELEQANKALREIKAQFEAVYNHHYQLTGLLDTEGRLLMGNRTALDFAGVDEQDVVGELFWETPWWTHSQEEQRKLREAITRALGGEFVRFESSHISHAGEKRDIDFCISPVFDDHGEVIYLVPEGYDVTERKAADELLRKSEARYRATIDNAADAFFLLHAHGKLVDVNQRACENLGYTRGELLSMHVTEVDRGLRKGQLEDIWNTLTADTDTAKSVTVEGIHQRRDGTTFPVEVRVGLLGLGDENLMLALVRDITDRKQAQDRVIQERDFSNQLINSMPSVVYMFDIEGTMIRWNQNLERITEYSSEEILHMRALDYFADEWRDDVSAAMREVFNEGESSVESRFLTKGGEEIPYYLTGTRLDYKDEPLLIVVGVDLAERKRAEEERKKLEAQLRQAQKMEAVGQLAGGVAHDFNNLLQAILGYGELATAEAEPGSVMRQELDEVMKAARSATALVQQLLAFSRRQVLKLEVLDPDEVVEDLAKMIRRIIGEHIAFNIHSEPGLKTILADRGQLEQIIMNLCVNGRDAMPEVGKLSIGTEIAELDEAFCKENSWAKPGRFALLSVHDTGSGMDEETRRRIFEPFFTTKDESSGTGLGLSTAYGIVRQHKGMIHVYSEVGLGTTFRIYLPLDRSSVAAGQDVEATTQPVGGTEVILLAEDDESVRNLTLQILENAGYTVLVARDGEEAIRLFGIHAGEVDLVLLDVVMPSLGGRAVYNHIRKSSARTPVLFSSGYASNGVHTNFVLNEGMQLIQKPYNIDDLLRRVRQALDA